MMLQKCLEEMYCLKCLLPGEDPKLAYTHAKKLEKQCKPMEGTMKLNWITNLDVGFTVILK